MAIYKVKAILASGKVQISRITANSPGEAEATALAFGDVDYVVYVHQIPEHISSS